MTTSDKRQVPGYYRLQVGKNVVTAIYDGYINLSPSLFHGLDDDSINMLIDQKRQLQTSEGIPTAVTTYLINDGTKKVLLNAGGGNGTMGNIQDNLRASGCSPEEISAILLTHMHFDHICGLVDSAGLAAFPNATIYVSETESGFWLDPANAEAAPEGNKAFFEMAASSIKPYKNAGRFKTFADDSEVLPGIKAITSNGHTPGHTSFLIGNGEKQLLLWGDIVHSHALQFTHPEVTNDFDSNQTQAAVSRASIFKKAAEENLLIAGDHLPFPGFGYLQKENRGYSWIPVEYTSFICTDAR